MRDGRAMLPQAHFHRNPKGRDEFAVFLRCSLLTYESTYARRSRLEKQRIDRRRKPGYCASKIPTHLEMKDYLASRQQMVDAALEAYLPKPKVKPETIHKAMRY